MEKDFSSQFEFFKPRLLVAVALCLAGVELAGLSFAENPGRGLTGTGDKSRGDSASERQVRQGRYRDKPVTYVVRHGKAIFQGDIILDKVDPINPPRSRPAFGIDSLGIDYYQYRWPLVGNQYEIPYVIAAGSGNLANLNNAITQFNSTFPNIKFVARTAQTDYVSFYFDPNDNSGQGEATLGRAGGEQFIQGAGGSFNPCTIGTILHEMGHAVGLWHEQARPDRNTYISVNYGNLIKGSITNFNQVYDNAQQTTLFDYASLMEYPAFAFSRNGGPPIETIPAGIPLSNPAGYSAGDIDGIERLYSSAPTAVTVTSNPPGLQVLVDGVTVTTPQIYDWSLNSNHTLDIPSGVQSQPGYIGGGNQPTTFYYIYGRWNDSTAISHNVTILPGNGYLATPATSPAVTTYSANFIQLVPYSSTVFPPGTGTVTPSPAPQSYPGSELVFYTARQQVTLTATPNAGQNFYAFLNGPYYLPGGLGANPKTFYVPDNGLTVNPFTEFSPDPVYTVNVAPNSFSSNLYIYADGGFAYAPRNFAAFYDASWTSGSTHTLSADTPQYPYSFGSRYVFNHWSDGAVTPSHSVILPATSTTYTANLTSQFYVTDYVYETCGGSINVTPASPTEDGFYPSGSALTFTETPNTGWLFTGWQYDLSGTSSSQPLTVMDEVLVTADYNTVTTPLALANLSPASIVAGSPGFILTLNGTGFTPSSVVSVNGAFPTVTFVDSTQVNVPVTAAQVTQPGAFQVWVDNFPPGATCAAFVALPFTVAIAPPMLTSLVSRMTHGSAGTFDTNFPLSGTRGVEPRTSALLGAGNYALIFTFANNLTSVANASVSSHDPAGGTGTVLSGAIGPNLNQYTVNLTNVSNAQYIAVTINGVFDTAGDSGNVTGPQIGVLVGDTNSNGAVSASDVGQTKAQSGQVTTGANFRTDVNGSGSITAADIGLVKSKSGTALPP